MPHPPLEQRSLLSRVGEKSDAVHAAPQASRDGAEGHVAKPTKKMVIDAEGKTYGRYQALVWFGLQFLGHDFRFSILSVSILKAHMAFLRAHA